MGVDEVAVGGDGWCHANGSRFEYTICIRPNANAGSVWRLHGEGFLGVHDGMLEIN